eukprot:1047921-Rhodomonas_salina.3
MKADLHGDRALPANAERRTTESRGGRVLDCFRTAAAARELHRRVVARAHPAQPLALPPTFSSPQSRNHKRIQNHEKQTQTLPGPSSLRIQQPAPAASSPMPRYSFITEEEGRSALERQRGREKEEEERRRGGEGESG